MNSITQHHIHSTKHFQTKRFCWFFAQSSGRVMKRKQQTQLVRAYFQRLREHWKKSYQTMQCCRHSSPYPYSIKVILKHTFFLTWEFWKFPCWRLSGTRPMFSTLAHLIYNVRQYCFIRATLSEYLSSLSHSASGRGPTMGFFHQDMESKMVQTCVMLSKWCISSVF